MSVTFPPVDLLVASWLGYGKETKHEARKQNTQVLQQMPRMQVQPRTVTNPELLKIIEAQKREFLNAG